METRPKMLRDDRKHMLSMWIKIERYSKLKKQVQYFYGAQLWTYWWITSIVFCSGVEKY
jgi:hypothetical protein